MDEWAPNAECELDAAELPKCEFSMLETARLLETVDRLLVLRLLVAAESDGELCTAFEFPAGAEPRLLAYVLEFVPPRAAVPDPELAGPPLRPMYGEEVVPRLPAVAAEPLLPRAEVAPDAPKRALDGGATPARLPAL